MTSINALLSELDCLTGKIVKLGKVGALLPAAQQAAYRTRSAGEYRKLRTLFRIRRAELVRLLGRPAMQEPHLEAHSESSELESDSCDVPYHKPQPLPRHGSQHSHHTQHTNHNKHRRTPEPCSSVSSDDVPCTQVGDLDSDAIDCDKMTHNNLYSPSDDPLSDGDTDLLGKMGDVVQKFIVNNMTAPSLINRNEKLTYDSESDIPSVFDEETDSTDDYDSSIVSRLASIRGQIEGVVSSGSRGNFDGIREMMQDVSRLRREKVDISVLNNHFDQITDALKDIGL